MEERNITVTLEKAQEWYNSGNESQLVHNTRVSKDHLVEIG